MPCTGTQCRDFQDSTHGARAGASGSTVISAPLKKPSQGARPLPWDPGLANPAVLPSGQSHQVGTRAVPHSARTQPAVVTTTTAG